MKVGHDHRDHRRDGGSPRHRTTLKDLARFCRHNRLTAECPICSRGTVLDPARSRARRATPRPRAKPQQRGGAGAAKVSRGPYASAGASDDGREIRLERVPGGLRLAAWHAGQIERRAPVLAPGELRGLLADAARKELLEELDLPEDGEVGDGEYGASPGRAGELRDELRVERLDGARVRIGRWIMRPNIGWQLQEAPILLPPPRFAQALSAAAEKGVLA